MKDNAFKTVARSRWNGVRKEVRRLVAAAKEAEAAMAGAPEEEDEGRLVDWLADAQAAGATALEGLAELDGLYRGWSMATGKGRP